MQSETELSVDWAGTVRAGLIRTIVSLVGSSECHVTEIPGLALFRHTAPTARIPVTFEPSVAVVVQGRKRIELRQVALTYDTSRFLVTSLDLPVVSQVVEASEEAPYLCMVLKLEMPMVREVLSREKIPTSAASSGSIAVATGKTTSEILDAFRRLLDLVNAPHDVPFLSGLIQREIVYRVVQSPAGARLRTIATLGDQSNRTAKAVAWLRSNYAKPLRIDDLAKHAGMGVSTFHRHFQALTSMSPLQYQKQLRLQAARGRMFVDGLDVASAAYEVGYESASQFTREYSRFFGHPPTRDIQALRLARS